MFAFVRKVGQLVGFVDEEKDNSQQKPKVKTKEDRIGELEESVELWTLANTIEWLELKGLGEFVPLFLEMAIDGDGILELAEDLFDVVNHSNDKAKTKKKKGDKKEEVAVYAAELKERLLKEMKVLKDKYEKPGLTYLEVAGELVEKEMSKWPPHEIPPLTAPSDATAEVIDDLKIKVIEFYHDRTRNTDKGGARALKRDWMNQPRCYRRYWGAPFIPLCVPECAKQQKSETEQPTKMQYQRKEDASFQPPPYTDLYSYVAEKEEADLLRTVSRLLFYSLSVTGHKGSFSLAQNARSAWSKRVNPSSGGLHPEECYVILPSLDEANSKPGVYHYSPREHALELRKLIPKKVWKKLTQGLPKRSFFVAVTTINWREVWKYGERGFRYAQLDVGHAIGAIRMAASMIGWKFSLVYGLNDPALASVLGISSFDLANDNDCEHAAVIGVMTPIADVKDTEGLFSGDAFQFPLDLVGDLAGKKSGWLGKANALSWDNLHWELVDKVVEATLNLSTEEEKVVPKNETHLLAPWSSDKLYESYEGAESGTIIRQRRSALDFVNQKISFRQFLSLLVRIMPSLSPIPFDVLPQTIHVPVIGIYVFGVKKLKSGFYLLIRDVTLVESLQESLPDLLWKKPKQVPSEIPLFLVKKGKPKQSDAESEDKKESKEEGEKEKEKQETKPDEPIRDASQMAACFQAIAKTSAFTMAMFAPMTPIMQTQGVHHYRNIHWEAGLVGHVLYLEAEAQGLGATGMGCFLDNTARADFGLEESVYHDFYHFTVGHKTVDSRFTQFNYEESMLSCVSL